MRKIIIFLFLCILAGLSFAPGFYRKQKIQPEHHEVTVRLVLVDVIATDKDGDIAAGLTKEDFEIFEDGKSVPINSLDFINFKRPSIGFAEKMEAPVRKKRFFVIFDSINTIRRMLNRSKARILDKLIELIRSGGEVMVMEMNEEGGIQILQPFSSDPHLIAQAVERASGSIWVERATDDLAIPDILGRTEVTDREIFVPGVGVEKSAKEIYQYKTRVRFEKSLSSLLSIMNMIKDYPGRKPVLLVSGGFPALSLDKLFSAPGIESEVAHSDIAAAKIFDPFKVLQKGGRRYEDDIFNDLIEYANSHNITFYSLDPDIYLRYVLPDISFDNFSRPNIAKIKQNELANLKDMALDTGGISLQGANKFDEFQKVLNKDLFSFYELSYYPKRKESDGKYHKIQVKVKKPGVNIRFRKGYYDYNPDQEESLLFASTAANPDLFKQIDFQARIVPFVSNRDKCILWINMGLPVKDLILSSDPNKEFKVIKANLWMDDPEDKDAFNARLDIPISLTPSFRQRLKQARYLGHNICSEEIRLDKDQYRFIIALFDQESGRVGTVVQALEIPVLKERSKSEIANVVFGLLRESREGGKAFTLSQKDGTLYVDRKKFYPMGSNRFSGKVTVSVFMQVLTPHINAEFKPEIVATQNDQIISQVPLKLVKQNRNKKAHVVNIVCDLDFSQFRKGSYELQIKLYDSSLNQEVIEKVQIQII
jgi:VWFA-related protein